MVLKGMILTVDTLAGCGILEGTDFKQLLIWEGVMALKELIFNSFYFGREQWFAGTDF